MSLSFKNFATIEHFIIIVILVLSILFMFFVGRFIYKTSSIITSIFWSCFISVALTIYHPLSLPSGGSLIVLFFLLKRIAKLFSKRFKPVFIGVGS